MNRGYVIGLIEVIEHHFPIARQPHGVGHGALPGIDLTRLPFVPDRAEVILQGPTLGVHVHPDETGKGLALELCEPQLSAGVPFREVFLVGRKLQHAVR